MTDSADRKAADPDGDGSDAGQFDAVVPHDDTSAPDRSHTANPARRAADLIARTDSSDAAVNAVRAARRLIPDAVPDDQDSRPSARLSRLIAEARPEQPSAIRELSLAALQVWTALTRRSGKTDQRAVPATILFTDLVGFSSWALDAGDDQVLRLLREVNRATEKVINRRGGRVVKNLGDGIMAVFVDGSEAIEAAYEAIGAVSALTFDGYRPQLRAGLHSGTPRSVGDDYFGVDVNIAARVAEAAGAGELLVSADTLAIADAEKYVRRKRRFKAKGVPRDLAVFAVIPRYDEDARGTRESR